MSETYSIRMVAAGDEAAWRELWKGYQSFYRVELGENEDTTTWARLVGDDTPGMGALVAETEDGRVDGFLNYVVHKSTWSVEPVCYLQDLFVSEAARGGGAARKLIERLAEMGREQDWYRIYWHTARDNAQAQILYNKVAERTGWVRYDLDLD